MKKNFIVIMLYLVIFYFCFIALHVSEALYRGAVAFIPDGLRGKYIEYVLSDRECFYSAYANKVLILEVLYEHKYEFDVRKLYSLCSRTSELYSEPIPQLAVRVINKYYPDYISGLLEYYKDDALNRLFIENQLDRLNRK